MILCLHNPLLQVSCLSAEVYSDFINLPCIRPERQGILFLFYLPQSLLCRTFQLKFHHIDILLRLQHQVNAPLRSMIFRSHVKTDQFENDKKHVLVMQFLIAYQLIRRVGKERLQAAEECVDFSAPNLLYEFRM